MSINRIRYTYLSYLILVIQSALCYGWRMGFVHSKCNRIRVNPLTGTESDLTYLKLYIHYRITITFDFATACRQSVAKTLKTSPFLKKNGGTAEDRLDGQTSLGPPKPPLVLKKHK